MDGLSGQLEIEASTVSPGHRLLIVRGEIEFRTAPMLRAAIDAALDGTGVRLAIDLAAVTFIDSSGLAVLIDVTTQASVVLRNPSRPVERVIAVTGLSTTLPIDHT